MRNKPLRGLEALNVNRPGRAKEIFNMAQSINSVVITGNVTKDAEKNPQGTVAKFDLAVSQKAVKDKDGNWTNPTEYISCKTFSKNIFDYIRKGMHVTVSGEIRQESWENKEGKKQSRIVVYANNIDLGPKPKTEKAPAADDGSEEAAPF